jgi:hypothetical protein
MNEERETRTTDEEVVKHRVCDAALRLSGVLFPCDLLFDHYGQAHSSQAAEAIWTPVPEDARVHITQDMPSGAMGTGEHVSRALALHVQDHNEGGCETCGGGWPCATYEILHGRDA